MTRLDLNEDSQASLRAAVRLASAVVRTPLLRSSALDHMTGCSVLIKPECLQVGGSFKYRGALNKLLQLNPSASRHVVAYSSGNHAVATALAAARLDWTATLVMPADAPAMKIALARAAGGRIEFYDRRVDDRVAKTQRLAEDLQAPIIPSFDDLDVIAGQSTVVLEMIQDAREQGIEIDDILVPCGGGGLLAGAVLAVQASNSQAQIYSVEPSGFDDMARSLASGVPQRNARRTGSICDALLIEQPGEVTLPIIARRVRGGIAVSDAEVSQAMQFAFRQLKLVVEPGGVVALAALLSGAVNGPRRTLGIVLSGGNVDSQLFASLIMDESFEPAVALA